MRYVSILRLAKEVEVSRTLESPFAIKDLGCNKAHVLGVKESLLAVSGQLQVLRQG